MTRMEITYIPLRQDRVLAIDPITRGFGFVLLETDPLRLVDWGTKTCAKVNPSECSRGLRGLVIRYQPSVVVLEDAREAGSLRSVALEAFLGAVAEVFASSSAPLRTYSRESIRRTFEPTGALSKEGIVRVLVAAFPELRSKVPPARMIWQSEDARMSIFDALSLAVTHLTLDRAGLEN